MTLIDTSVWIEYLRGTDSTATTYVREHIGSETATTEPVLMELLAGASSRQRTLDLERLLLSQPWHPVDAGVDYRGAVDVYQATRATGHQPRSLQDCLIAAVALRNRVDVAHRDSDYEYIAQATGLGVVDLRV